ncbi:Retrovirus-related Pol polyprotein from transposon gypsy, partial [Mucuna pruriens]
MPFGLTNGTSTFMRLINHVLRSLIGKCVVDYFDDILIYTCLNDHLLHVKNVFFVVGSHGVKVDSEKEWPTPIIVGEVRSFHRLASFYQRFVKDFSSLAAPLNDVITKCRFQVGGGLRKSFPRAKGKTHPSSNSYIAKIF